MHLTRSGGCSISWQRRKLLGNWPIFTVVMLIYHYVERIWKNIITPLFCITYTIVNKYYLVEPVSILIKSLINIIQEINWEVTTKKKGKGKLPLFHGNGERLIPIYVAQYELIRWLKHEWMSHWVIWDFLLKVKHPPIKLGPQNGLVNPGIDLNPKTGK